MNDMTNFLKWAAIWTVFGSVTLAILQHDVAFIASFVVFGIFGALSWEVGR